MVSVIVVTHNQLNCLKDCLQSLHRQSFKDFETLIVVNEAPGVFEKYLRRNFPQANLIVNKENLLYCKAHNQGIGRSKGEYILCLNDDVILEPEFIGELVKAAGLDNRIGMVSGKILRSDDRATIDTTGLFLGRARVPLERGFNAKDKGQYDKAEYIFGVGGCAAFYRREMLEELKDREGYFDERFGIFYEDLDLAWRANRLGWKGYYNPRAIAYHQRGATVKNPISALGFLRKYKFAYLSDEFKARLLRNRYATIRKNDSFLGLVINTPFILFYELKVYLYIVFFCPRLLIQFFKENRRPC